MAEDITLKTEASYKTRYRLWSRYVQFDTCIPGGEPAYSFDLSIIDNSNGDEVMVFSGNECEHIITEKFSEWIQGTARGK